MHYADTTKDEGRHYIVLRPSSSDPSQSALASRCRRWLLGRRLLRWRLGWRGRCCRLGVVRLDQATILLGLGMLVGQQLLELLPALLLDLLRDLRFDLLLCLLLAHRRPFAAANQLDDVVAKLGLHRLLGRFARLEILEHGLVELG